MIKSKLNEFSKKEISTVKKRHENKPTRAEFITTLQIEF